jgi:hypothetical protein
MPSVVMLATFDGGKFTVGTSESRRAAVDGLDEEHRDQPAETVSAVWI